MTDDKPPTEYRNIHRTPARDLLDLSYAELDAFIEQADKVADEAQTLGSWLRWIRVEKRLSEENPVGTPEGGDS